MVRNGMEYRVAISNIFISNMASLPGKKNIVLLRTGNYKENNIFSALVKDLIQNNSFNPNLFFLVITVFVLIGSGNKMV